MKPAIFILTALFLAGCGGDSTTQTPQTNQPVVADDATQPDNNSNNNQNPTQDGSTPDTTDNVEQNNTNDPADPDTANNTPPPANTNNPPVDNDPGTTTPNPGTDPNAGATDPADNGTTVAGSGCTAPAAGTTIVSATTPLHPNDNPDYYAIMGPQCVVPGSQFDGPGLAYGDFLLINNAWNGQQSSWNWQQCISVTTAQDGSILPSWTYDWGNEDDLQPGLFEWEVKSYPEVIYGAVSNSVISAPCTTTGLPVQMQDVPQISIAYNYRAVETSNRVGDQGDEANNPTPVTGGDRNIAIETFFHSSCDIKRGSESNMQLELMVWLEVGNERLPSGSPPNSVFTNTAGEAYDVYTKPGTDNYIAFVAQNEVTAGTLNWNEFIDHAKSNAGTYAIKPIQDSWCLANIIFGSEIWWGEGAVNLDYYQITSQY